MSEAESIAATPDSDRNIVPAYNMMDDLYLVFEELYLTTNAAQVSVEGIIRSESIRRNSILFTIIGAIAYFLTQVMFTVSSDSAP